MFINKECELHDMLKLHAPTQTHVVTGEPQCSCGILLTANNTPCIPDKCLLSVMLVGEEVLRRLATGRADDPDWAKLKRLGITPVDTLSGILAELDDVAITAKAESAQAEFIEVAIELYQKYEFSVGRSVLRDTVCNKLAEDRWKRNETLHIQAKAPIELGWNFIAETERNITSGNKARIYERDGKIAIQHSQTLTPLHHWKMRCYQLFELMFNVCDDHRIHGQLNPKLTKWVKRFDK